MIDSAVVGVGWRAGKVDSPMATKPSQQPTHGSPAADSLNWQVGSLNWQASSLNWQVDSPGGRGRLRWEVDSPGRKLALAGQEAGNCPEASSRSSQTSIRGAGWSTCREDNWSSRLVDSVVAGVGRRAGKVDSTDVEAR
jgi:hypothetical protein